MRNLSQHATAREKFFRGSYLYRILNQSMSYQFEILFKLDKDNLIFAEKHTKIFISLLGRIFLKFSKKKFEFNFKKVEIELSEVKYQSGRSEFLTFWVFSICRYVNFTT